jgi:hypothetical protein
MAVLYELLAGASATSPTRRRSQIAAQRAGGRHAEAHGAAAEPTGEAGEIVAARTGERA